MTVGPLRGFLEQLKKCATATGLTLEQCADVLDYVAALIKKDAPAQEVAVMPLAREPKDVQ